MTLGDNAYESGSASEYAGCYGPTWGRHKARTRPSPGNHEYDTSGAAGYFGYVGAVAGPAGLGYHSFDVRAWHVVSLNSEQDVSASGAQLAWLRSDLAATGAGCVLAFFHRPRFTAGRYSDFTAMTPFWDALYAENADVVLNGHDHIYERYRPMNPAGNCGRRITLRYANRMAQLVTRLDDRLLAEVDGLVADGVVANRSEAVRLGLERLVDQHQRQQIGAAIVDAYRRRPQTDEELTGLDEATRALVNEEPW